MHVFYTVYLHFEMVVWENKIQKVKHLSWKCIKKLAKALACMFPCSLMVTYVKELKLDAGFLHDPTDNKSHI